MDNNKYFSNLFGDLKFFKQNPPACNFLSVEPQREEGTQVEGSQNATRWWWPHHKVGGLIKKKKKKSIKKSVSESDWCFKLFIFALQFLNSTSKIFLFWFRLKWLVFALYLGKTQIYVKMLWKCGIGAPINVYILCNNVDFTQTKDWISQIFQFEVVFLNQQFFFLFWGILNCMYLFIFLKPRVPIS